MKNKYYKKQLAALNKKYRKDVSSIEDAMEYAFIGDNYYYGTLTGVCMKLRFFYLMKWAEREKIDISFEEFPVISECESYDEEKKNAVEMWSEWIQYALEGSVYETGFGTMGSCCGNLIYVLSRFGWEIEEIDYYDVRMAVQDGIDVFSDVLPEDAAVQICNYLDEFSECDEVWYILLKNERLGMFMEYMKKHPNKKDSALYRQIEKIVSVVENLFYHHMLDLNISGVYKKGYFSAVAYGNFPSWETYLSPTIFDPINIIRAYYLEQYLDIAEYMYGYQDKVRKAGA